ncbi:MAG: hypothetical protein JWN27_2171 [Candidatus Eremiobacteraeota bacterium]|nr:hypothetical protein [Candidatus Eremiobacteraeota bacterium]
MSGLPGAGRTTAVPRGELIARLVTPAADAAKLTAPSAAPAPLDPPLPPPVLHWLTQLTLLYGVPFPYLVPDANLLPPESLRFFYVDQNWLDRAVDGALSVATISTAEQIFGEELFAAVYAAIAQSQQGMRAALRDKPAPSQVLAGATYAGLLFRSVVVAGWPGLEVYATKNGAPVSVLRMDRLSPTVLLVLFSDVPTEVDFVEPSESLHFGLLSKGGNVYETTLRGCGFAGYAAGAQIPDPTHAGAFLTATTGTRTGANQPAGVVDIATMAANIATAMPAGALGTVTAPTSGEFALQMVQSAGKQVFTVSSASRDCAVTGAPR